MIPIDPTTLNALLELASEGRRSTAERLFIEQVRATSEAFLKAQQAQPKAPPNTEPQ